MLITGFALIFDKRRWQQRDASGTFDTRWLSQVRVEVQADNGDDSRVRCGRNCTRRYRGAIVLEIDPAISEAISYHHHHPSVCNQQKHILSERLKKQKHILSER